MFLQVLAFNTAHHTLYKHMKHIQGYMFLQVLAYTDTDIVGNSILEINTGLGNKKLAYRIFRSLYIPIYSGIAPLIKQFLNILHHKKEEMLK